MSEPAPVIESSTAHVVLGRWRNLYVTEWRQRGDAEKLDAIYELQRRHLESISGQMAMLTVIQGGAVGTVDREMRAAIQRGAAILFPRTVAGATVILGGGFGGAIARSLLTGVNLIQRQRFPNKIASSVAEACDFVAAYIDGKPAPYEVEAVYRTIVAAPPQFSSQPVV
jgi:hypothetical protein